MRRTLHPIKTLHIQLFCFLFAGLSAATSCDAQGTLVGGPCEGCEAVFEYRQEGVTLTPTDTLPGFTMEGEEPKLRVTGTVYRSGGEEPAEDVILYIHQTNAEGIYPKRGDEQGWASRHGYFRGWVKTDADGRYTFYTTRPGSYPGSRNPAHIHITVLEPDGDHYWINDFNFADDPLLTEEMRSPDRPRGGEGGVIDPEMRDGILTAERDIELGKNVEGYEDE